MTNPVPFGTCPTIFPSGAKFSVLLFDEILLKTLTNFPLCFGKSVKSITKIFKQNKNLYATLLH